MASNLTAEDLRLVLDFAWGYLVCNPREMTCENVRATRNVLAVLNEMEKNDQAN